MTKKRKKKAKNRQLDIRHESEDTDEEIADDLSS